jgi:bis(5'-nucleosyl)-tetraphosphatase (symmetrical)
LLDRCGFDPAADRLWLVGDLVNRGPDSLACLRFVRGLGASAVTVLGNHDLHLICRAHGAQGPRRRDTLDEVLAAPDRDELIDWLCHRPLMHVEGGYALLHAGLLPQWSVERACALAAEVEAQLRGRGLLPLLEHMYGDEPVRWDEALTGFDRLRVIINAMTRLRVCAADGSMMLAFKGEPGESAGAARPWFDYPGRLSASHAIVCGHWSALGVKLRPDLLSLDSGCVWGRALTALRLEDRSLHSVQCPG